MVAVQPAPEPLRGLSPVGWLLPAAEPAGPELRPGGGLSLVALEAMRRDGVVRRVAGDVYLPVAAWGHRRARASAVRALVPPDAVVGLLAAAWVHGAPVPPEPVVLLVPRAVAAWSSAAPVRQLESRTDPGDVVEVAGLRLTGPERTAADLARHGDPAHAVVAVGALVAAGLDVDRVLARFGPRTPHVTRARRLLAEVSSPGGRCDR